MFSFLLFLSYPSIAFVVVVGFGREGLVHFDCSCHCIWCIGLSSPRRIGWCKLEAYSWVLGPPSLLFPEVVPGACYSQKLFPELVTPGSCSRSLRLLVATTWEPPIKLWRLPQTCTGSVTALKGPIVDRVILNSVRVRGEYGEPLWRLEGHCASTPLQ